MKKTILTTIASMLAVAAFAQGSVTFQNAATVAGWAPAADRNVKFGPNVATFNALLVPGQNVSSNYAGVNLSNYRAALYYAPGTIADVGNNWTTVNQQAQPTTGSALATFKQSTSATAGSWFGGSRTMNGVATAGGAATLMVIVWDSSLSSDPFSQAALGGLWGRSALFSYTTPTSATPAPAEFLPNNLGSFTIDVVPEPTSMALAGLGAASLLLFRRRK